MTFKEFWPQYLRAHSLPGTRSLHYFASVIGVMSVIEAILARQPLLLAGIGLGYALAIGAHKFIESNKPMIRVNAFWGMVADMRMCWLALTGGLGREIDRNRVDGEADDAIGAARRKRMRFTPIVRVILLGVATVGLVAGLLDLDDLFETEIGLHYPLIQLGAPIVAFAGALFLGVSAMAKALSALSHDDHGPMPAAEASLWRASVALLAFGGLAQAMAEFAEHGYSGSAAAIAFGALTSLIAVTPALLVGTGAAQREGLDYHPGMTVVVAKEIGRVGGAACLLGSLGILGLQIGRWMMVGWEPFPVSAALSRLGFSGGEGLTGFGWILDSSAALAAFAAALLLALVWLSAASLERQRNEAWLFKTYLEKARGADPTRQVSERSATAS